MLVPSAGLRRGRGTLVGMRQLGILGSTGSIGTQALDVVRRNPDRFKVVGLSAAGMNQELFVGQIREFLPPLVAIADEEAAATSRHQLGPLKGVEFIVGPDAAEQLARDTEARSRRERAGRQRGPGADARRAAERARRSRWPTRSRSSSAASS